MSDVRTFLEIQPGLMDRLRNAIEALVDVLDSLEGEPDLEEACDDNELGDADGVLEQLPHLNSAGWVE